MRAFDGTARNPRKFLVREHNYWLLAAKNSVKRLSKLKMPVALRSAWDGETGVGDSASGYLPAVCKDGPCAADRARSA
jgi:hypothetical protein